MNGPREGRRHAPSRMGTSHGIEESLIGAKMRFAGRCFFDLAQIAQVRSRLDATEGHVRR